VQKDKLIDYSLAILNNDTLWTRRRVKNPNRSFTNKKMLTTLRSVQAYPNSFKFVMSDRDENNTEIFPPMNYIGNLTCFGFKSYRVRFYMPKERISACEVRNFVKHYFFEI
jgi:RNase P/RNase MRP subunit p30